MRKKIENLLIYKILRDLKNFIAGSVRLIRWHADQIARTIKDHYFDKRLGVQTGGHYYFRETSANKDMAVYSAAPYGRIQKIIDYLKLTPDDVFIDIGCGAGRVIFFIAAQNLKKVIGVELNEELIDAARQNYRALKLRNSPVEIVCADAAVFNMDEGTIFFMYNPFGYKTLRKVVANIKKSIEASPRKIRIVYYGLWHRHLLDDEDWLELEKEMDRGEILIWHNKY